MFWNFDSSWLADPQNQNAYAYARNNPIVGSDPSGLIVVTVSGTTEVSGGGPSNYLKDDRTLQGNIRADFKGQDIFNFTWSGKDNDNARQVAAKELSIYVSGLLKNYSADEPLNFVSQSHGCNIVALYTQQEDAHQINNSITFAQPVLNGYSVNESKINNHINVYSNGDKVQRIAGNQTSASAVLGYLMFGLPGYLAGNAMDWIEFGWAGRTVNGANNRNATNDTKGNWISNHGELYKDSDVWENNIHKNIKN